jgi:hypothetical protein
MIVQRSLANGSMLAGAGSAMESGNDLLLLAELPGEFVTAHL